MNKLITAFSTLIIISLNILAQDNWSRYSWGTADREGFTVLLPTIPEQISKENGEQGIKAFSSFTDFITYNATFMDGVNQIKFDKQLKEWKLFTGMGSGSGGSKEEYDLEINKNHETREISICGYDGIEFGNSNSVQRFFLIDERLYHLWVSGANQSNSDAAKFLDSFSLVNPWRIWKGARTNEDSAGLGTNKEVFFRPDFCRNIGKSKNQPVTTKLPPNSPLNIISTPQAQYPEEAKKKKIQGTVSLRITFLNDGTIGKISVVKGINKEMDESAIKAAQKIKFEPERKKGKSVTVIKIIKYNYVLY